MTLRSPWFHAPLGLDEGGVAMVARSWHTGGPFAYGNYFLDRPPLLVGLYGIFGSLGPAGIRLLGALGASLLVTLTTLLAVRLGGRAAAPWAAGMSAVMASSAVLTSVFTPAELLAASPSCASILLLVVALERDRRRLWLLVGAGLLAASALLVKQSFGDALAAGAVALVGMKAIGVPWGEWFKRAVAYAAGVGTVMGAVFLWALLTSTSVGSIYYALFGFRVDAVSALANSGTGTKIAGLAVPAVTSGVAVTLVLAGLGIASLRGRPLLRLVLSFWLLAGLVGLILGGSYWHHYLIELVPGAVAGAAVTLAHHRRVAVLALASMAVPAGAVAISTFANNSSALHQEASVIVGKYVKARALPGQTIDVMYARVNVLYYSGLRDPFPYNWSLMMRAAPHAQARLRRLLASGGRPTWVVQWQSHRAFGLDRSGATEQALKRNYRRVSTVCGQPVFLARGAGSRPAPLPAGCGHTSSGSPPLTAQ